MPTVVTKKKVDPRNVPLFFLLLLLQAVGFSPAHAFSLLGYQDLTNPARWSDAALESGITFSIAPNFYTIGSGDPSAAIRNAFGTFSEANSTLSFYESGRVRLSPYAGAKIDVFAMPSTFRYGQYAFNGDLAFALVGTYQGEILGADIYFNRGYAWSDNPGPDQFDIQSVALHEIGHALGLEHPDIADDLGVNYDAFGVPIPATGLEVMNSTIEPGEISRGLTADDVAGLAYLYPGAVRGSGGGLIASQINPVPEPSTVMLLLPGLLVLFYAVRRKFSRLVTAASAREAGSYPHHPPRQFYLSAG